MPTTIVYPSIDVSATASISMVVGTAATFAGSLSASSLTVTGTATFSGTCVHLGTLQVLATATFSATTAFLTDVIVKGNVSISGAARIAGAGEFLLGAFGLRVSLTASASSGRFEYNANAENVGFDMRHQGSAAWSMSSLSVGGATNRNFLFFNEQLGSSGLRILGDDNTLVAAGVGLSVSGAVNIQGFPAGSVLLGSASLGTGTSLRFSGSWSDYGVLELRTFFKATPSGSVNINIYTDGGTTTILTCGGLGSATASHMLIDVDIYNGTAFKCIAGKRITNAVVNQAATATANTGFLNALMVSVGTSLTLSSGMAQLYGRRR